jgi:hypothetical protein
MSMKHALLAAVATALVAGTAYAQSPTAPKQPAQAQPESKKLNECPPGKTFVAPRGRGGGRGECV